MMRIYLIYLSSDDTVMITGSCLKFILSILYISPIGRAPLMTLTG